MTVTFLTGASSGIGRSLARRLAAHGDAVAVAARRGDLLDSLVDEIATAGGRAFALPCDVTDGAAVVAAVRAAEAALGPIERLVANAGGGKPRDAVDFSAAEIEQTLALNVIGTAHCIEAVLPGMLERRRGHIVATSSLAAYRGLPNAAAYSAAKAALNNMLESLRIDLRAHGIAVSIICPGFVRVKESATKKRKPLQMEVEDATRLMHGAILRQAPHYAFPWPLVLTVNLARLLPAAIYDRILAGKGPR